jgi:alanine racemase
VTHSGADSAGLVLSIDLGALARNWTHLAKLSAPSECAAVVKADAYGIGVEAAVPALWAAGCRTFFVAVPQEGHRVRKAAPGATIYVLNSFAASWAETCRASRLRPVLGSFGAIEAWASSAPGEPSAVQVDTGMNRLGLSLHEALELSRRRDLLNAAGPRMIMSHFACADEPSHPMNLSQLALFREIRREFPGLSASLANSAGIHLGADTHFDMVRPGIALYGAEFISGKPPLATVVTAKARLMQVRQAAAGETIGYGAGKRLEEDTRIAILSAGYADGYHRLTGSSDARRGAAVSIRGKPARIMGRVSMDLITVDVSDIPGVVEGDWAELFGPSMPVDEAARAANTVGYEFLTQMSRRAERIYVDAAGAD